MDSRGGAGGDAGAGGGGLSLMFTKEEVKPLSDTPATSLLSSSLKQRTSAGASRAPPMSPIKIQHRDRRRPRETRVIEESKAGLPVHSPSGGLTPPASVAAAARSSLSAGSRERSRSMAEERSGFSVAYVIDTIVTYVTGTPDLPLALPKAPHEYQLRIAEDSSTVIDDDFPELDGTVEVISVGVTHMLLSEAASDRVVAGITLPADVIGLRREHRAALKTLDVTVNPLGGTGAPFVVKVASALESA